MTLSYLKRFAGVAFIAATALFYQNCGQGFSADLMEESLNLALSSPAPKHEDLHITSSSGQTNTNSDLEFIIQAEETSLQGLSFQWSHTLNGVLGGCIVKSQDQSSSYVLNCPRAGTLAIAAKVTEGTISTVLQSYSVAVVDPPPANEELSLTVTFDIPDKTGSTPWNTEATVVETFVGQILKINNKDSVTHQLHTNGKPCGHGAAIATGSSANCVIGTAYNYKTDGIVYDHILGTKSTFYLIAYDGSTLYTQNCASCHGALASSEKKGAKIADIKRGLASVPTMQSNPNLMKLTQRQIEAIAYALGK